MSDKHNARKSRECQISQFRRNTWNIRNAIQRQYNKMLVSLNIVQSNYMWFCYIVAAKREKKGEKDQC